MGWSGSNVDDWGNWSPGDTGQKRRGWGQKSAIRPIDYEIPYWDWYKADRGKLYGIKSGKSGLWSGSSIRTYNAWAEAGGQANYPVDGEEEGDVDTPADNVIGYPTEWKYPEWLLRMAQWRGF